MRIGVCAGDPPETYMPISPEARRPPNDDLRAIDQDVGVVLMLQRRVHSCGDVSPRRILPGQTRRRGSQLISL